MVQDGIPASQVSSTIATPDPSRWCITREDLDKFEEEVRKAWKNNEIPDDPKRPSRYHNDEKVGPTMYQVNKHFIKPRTAGTGKSWALNQHPDGLECDVFATHAWIEGVFEFCARVRAAWPQDAHHLYVCFLANDQNGDISAMLDCDVMDSPFAKALGKAKYMIVIPNKNESIYHRLWCVLEAYIAVTKGMIIRLPVDGLVDPNVWVGLAMLGFVSFACSLMLSVIYIAPMIGWFKGPFVWQLMGFYACFLLSSVSRILSFRLECTLRQEAKVEISVSAVELGVAGICAGVSLWQLHHQREHDTDEGHYEENNFVFEGQYAPTLMIILSMILLHVYSVFLAVHTAVMMLEGAKLDFDSVRNAKCSSDKDKARINEHLEKHYDAVDEAIYQLKVVGRHSRELQFNLNHGLCLRSAREGINPCKVCSACFLWTYWWIVDASDITEEIVEDTVIKREVILVLVQCLLVLLSLVFVYWIGEKAIFAINSAFWCGLAFATVSCFEYVWKHERKEWESMSGASLQPQVFFLLVTIILDVCFYKGLLVGNWACDTCEGAYRKREVERDEAGHVEDTLVEPLHLHEIVEPLHLREIVAGIESYGAVGRSTPQAETQP